MMVRGISRCFAAKMLSDPSVYALALLAALCIGLSKAGFSGISMVSVVLLADIYGSKASVGLALPLLIAADLMAYPAFLKHGSWRPVWKLLGPALLGIAAGWWVLGEISEITARRVIGGCVLLMVALQVFRRWQAAGFDRLAESGGFGLSAGVLGGFATMLANAAGPVIQLYLMARRVPKMELIGIGARFCLLINLIKVPLNARLALVSFVVLPLMALTTSVFSRRARVAFRRTRRTIGQVSAELQENIAAVREEGALQLYVDGRYSQVSSSDLRPEALDTFIGDSITMTRVLAEDPFRALPEPVLYEGRAAVDLQLDDICTSEGVGSGKKQAYSGVQRATDAVVKGT